MTSTEGASERAEPPCIRPEPPVDAHSPGKATASGGCAVITDGGSKVTANGVHDLENRILRITGYYGYNRGYSSHKSECKERKVPPAGRQATSLSQLLRWRKKKKMMAIL